MFGGTTVIGGIIDIGGMAAGGIADSLVTISVHRGLRVDDVFVAPAERPSAGAIGHGDGPQTEANCL